MRPRLRILLPAVILCLLTGCVPRPDPDQARLCRIAVVAVAPGGAVEIERQAALPETRSQPGVRIDYRQGPAEAPGPRAFAECRFASGKRPDLVGLRSDAGAMSETSLFFLKRFWLETAEGERADPEPFEVWGSAPVLPQPLAYALQILLNGLPAMASYGLLAASYSLIYGLIGRINLAFGQMAAIGGAASLAALALLNEPGTLTLILVAVLAALWAAITHGVVIGRWVFTPLRRSTSQQGLVATVGLALVLDEYLRLMQGPAPPWIKPLRTPPIAIARSATFPVTLTPVEVVMVVASATLAVCVLALMRYSQFGRNWRAMADDARAAALMGVSPTGMFARSFALASALAGASGATVVLVYGSFGPSFATILGLKALLAAVLGGIGSVPGAFAGGVTLGVLETVWSAFFPIDYRDLVVFIVLASTLVMRPGGLLGYGDLVPRRV